MLQQLCGCVSRDAIRLALGVTQFVAILVSCAISFGGEGPARALVSDMAGSGVEVSPRIQASSVTTIEVTPQEPQAVVAQVADTTVPAVAQKGAWQACGSSTRCGVACPGQGCTCPPDWRDQRSIPWQIFAHGEYIGPARTAHVPEYHLRVDDSVRCVYGLTGNASPRPYELTVGDVVKIESLTSPNLNREALVQPDGAITLPLVGPVAAAGHSLAELRDDLEKRYVSYVKAPQISVTPQKINTRVEELRMSVDQRYGHGGQGVIVRITPAGTVQLPAIGSVPAQGLTLDELKAEIEARYDRRFYGVEITPILEERAPRYAYVVGEVKNPGRFKLEAPTTVMQAIAMAGGWNIGAKLRSVVVFRRDENWCLMATQLDLHSALAGKQPCPADEIWLRDSDLVLVPKSAVLATDEWIYLLFTRGVYGVVPFNLQMTFTKLTTL